jgi:hypothetical protein
VHCVAKGVIRADGQLLLLGEIVIATVARACFGFVEIRSVSVKPEVHFILDASFGMSDGVIKKVANAKADIFPSASGDGRGNGADNGLHGVVNSS